MGARELFPAAARAAFAGITLGPAIRGSGARDRPGVQFGCTDGEGYLQECGRGDTARWFLADRVSQGITVAQQLHSAESPGPVYPLCQWEVEGEDGERDVEPISVRITYRVVSLVDAHVWYPPEAVDLAGAVSLRWFDAAGAEAEGLAAALPAGGYRTLPAAELDARVLAGIYSDRRELLSFREGPLAADDGEFLGFFESVRSVSLWD